MGTDFARGIGTRGADLVKNPCKSWATLLNLEGQFLGNILSQKHGGKRTRA